MLEGQLLYYDASSGQPARLERRFSDAPPATFRTREQVPYLLIKTSQGVAANRSGQTFSLVWGALKMGKTKMEMKRIQNPSRRQVTFSKRKNGLLKKAFELSLLCDAEVALIIFSETGKICEFASHNDMATILEKYRTYTETEGNMESSSVESVKIGESQLKALREKMNKLKKKERNMVGEDLDSLTIKELQRLENQLKIGIKRISDKKMKILVQNSKLLLQKVRALEEEKIELETKLRTRGDSFSSATNLNLGLSYSTMPSGLCDMNSNGDCLSSEIH